MSVPGLEAFSEDDAEFFHGRDSDIARVHRAVHRRPVTLLAGPSGCGKSSLVRAGVLPRLRAEGMTVSELRPVPGARPSAVLARALTAILEPALGEVERLARAEELAGLLESGGDVPAELRGRVLTREQAPGTSSSSTSSRSTRPPNPPPHATCSRCSPPWPERPVRRPCGSSPPHGPTPSASW
ncbi:hypothetical protein DN402_33990 [Streptomyces sp. SW4]|nr:hypothetical protein DN402_33990 [Streptomyces sp. SW4]